MNAVYLTWTCMKLHNAGFAGERPTTIFFHSLFRTVPRIRFGFFLNQMWFEWLILIELSEPVDSWLQAYPTRHISTVEKFPRGRLSKKYFHLHPYKRQNSPTPPTDKLEPTTSQPNRWTYDPRFISELPFRQVISLSKMTAPKP